MSFSEQLPQEIVHEIFRHISDDLPTLCPATLTCRAWAQAGNGYLWKHPPLSALAAVLPASRRQSYCHTARHLDLGTEDRIHLATFQQPQFPRLRNLSIEEDQNRSMDNDDEQIWFQQLLQPSIVSFVCNHVAPNLGTNLLNLLETRCPRLQHIALSNYKDMGITDQDFIQFLDHFPSLRSINIGSAPGGTEVVSYISARKNLECLKLSRSIETVDIEAMFEKTPHQSLLLLETEEVADNKVTPTLVAKLTALTEIGLGVVNPVSGSLHPLSNLSNLVSLSLNVKLEDGQGLDIKEFDDFAQLKQLRRFEINIDDTDLVNFEAEWLDDDYFSNWITNFPDLEYLTLRIKSRLSSTALMALAKTCRRLQGLEVTGVFDVTSWGNVQQDQDAMILFPNLTMMGGRSENRMSSFRLSSSTGEEIEPLQDDNNNNDDATKGSAMVDTTYDPPNIVNAILQQAPKLERLYLDTACREGSCMPLSGFELLEQKRRDNFSRSVVHAFKERTHQMYDS